MRIRQVHPWDVSVEEAVDLQLRLAARAQKAAPFRGRVRRVAGADLAYDKRGDRIWAAVVLFSYPDLQRIEEVVDTCRVHFPYIPGLFSFREAPPILDCLERLRSRPDVIMLDAHGIAHPRRFGLASHVGLLASLPSIGCAKSRLVGAHETVPSAKGGQAPVYYNHSKVGTALRTRAGVRPVYVSPGYRLSVGSATAMVLACAHGHRIPEPIRAAHDLANRARRLRSIQIAEM
ncbi:MAG: endonuclease V [Acidobacteria bacterium]|nr:endonuclease V [Acidobacteriota bacterium]